MKKIVFFTSQDIIASNAASAVTLVNEANASAELGYSTVLVYCDSKVTFTKGMVISPDKPGAELKTFYRAGEKLEAMGLPVLTSFNPLKVLSRPRVLKYFYLPHKIFPRARLVYTRDWHYARLSIKNRIPTIYEYEHKVNFRYDSCTVLSPFFKATVTVAEPIVKNMIENGIPAEKIIKLPLGVNKAFFEMKKEQIIEWRKRFSKKIALFAGQLCEFKGVDLAIKCAERLPELEFVFAGGTADRVKAYKEKAYLENVTFLGHLSHEDLISLMHASDVLLMPHLSGADAAYTSPLKFFEYLASGNPIVATTIPAMSEYVPKDLSIQWCDPDDADVFKAAIQNCLAKYPRREDGYQNNIAFARALTWEKRIERIFQIAGLDLRGL